MSDFIYEAKVPDQNGLVNFTKEEHEVWQKLFARQIKLVEGRACAEFMDGLKLLELNENQIPQLADVSKKLKAASLWEVVPVKALISFKEFFDLLANRQFPAATFIRRMVDIDYLKEPDIFHEIFGHCPLLTNEHFANFTHRVGEIGQTMSKEERVMLARLYWFTVEFGLIKRDDKVQIFGGGILSSKEETIYALESDIPKRQDFDLLTILCTAYRYDELQKNYFIIPSFEELYSLINIDLSAIFKIAKEKGMIDTNNTDVRSC